MSDTLTRLKQLLSGEIKPSLIVGTGYVYPKKTASEYLRRKLANSKAGNCPPVDGIVVTSSGKAFKSEAAARSSKTFTQLMDGTVKLFTDKLVVSDFGVWPAVAGDGYEIYVCTKPKS